MLDIRNANTNDFTAVRAFYHDVIKRMESSPYAPGWKIGIYPSDDDLMQALSRGELYFAYCDGIPAAAMVVNHACNEGYKDVQWPTDADESEVSVIHMLCVHTDFSGRGFAKQLVQEAVTIAKKCGSKVIRLDVLSGNLPAEKLYVGLGFRYVDTVSMFYEDTGWTDFLLYEYVL